MIKKYAIALSAAAVMMMSGSSAVAEEVQVDGAVCGLNSNQISNGFRCTAETSVTNVSRQIGNNQRCQDATTTQTTFRAYNQNNQLMSDRTEVTEPERSDWGSSYPIGDGCNNPLL